MPTEPDAGGHFGEFGGRFVPETLIPALDQQQAAFSEAMADSTFLAELEYWNRTYTGRPSLLYHARALTERIGGAEIYLKREDLNHTGAHKINNTIGQALLTRRMGKHKLIAETGAGQHGVATATVAALFQMECEVFMGAEDVRRQSLNVRRMELLGTRVTAVESGSRTLKDAINEALRAWVASVDDTHYVIGSVMGPHPFPKMVRTFQSVIGQEARSQILEMTGRLPDLLVAAVGGGSNAAGLFHPFLDDAVAMVGVEAAGEGLDARHAATLSRGRPGVLHGARSYVLQDEEGQILEAHSLSAGLDYPGVGPEHSLWKESGRVRYASCTDQQAVSALIQLSQTEGVLCALESAHAVAEAIEQARRLGPKKTIVVCLSGRGDKDVEELNRYLEAHRDGQI